MITAEAVLDLEAGSFRIAFHENDERTCVSVSTGTLSTPGVLVRVHSSCLFGEALGACDCDCGPQLRSSLREIARVGAGVVTYTYEEGRGAGLAAKIRGMNLQLTGRMDTYAAFEHLGLPPDSRDYAAALGALRDLGVSDVVSLISNNPMKRATLEAAGYRVQRTVAIPYAVDSRARRYLHDKRDIAKHTLDLSQVTFLDDRE